LATSANENLACLHPSAEGDHPVKRFASADEYFDRLEIWSHELAKLRKIVLSCSLQETVKWGGPVYTVDEVNVLGIGAFRNWAALWFFQGALMSDPQKVLVNAQADKTQALRQWRFTDGRQIKVAPIRKYVREAAELARAGKSVPLRRDKPLAIPAELAEALGRNKKARLNFDAMSKSCKREYAEYISEARKPQTRLRRLDKILPMIINGGGLNDKYR
jgi:uncharacterized protein YdeI (YjbR/CyaY-like superfamily)